LRFAQHNKNLWYFYFGCVCGVEILRHFGGSDAWGPRLRRVHSGFFANREMQLIVYVTPRLPTWITPDHLTALAACGAVVASIALVLSWFSAWFLLIVIAGLIANWIGDSLDGALARYRRVERHRVGFLLDRSCDLLAFFCLFVALAASPYTTPFSALLFLLAYLLHTFYAILRVVVDGVHHIGVGGFGATEGRIAIASWVLFSQLIGVEKMQSRLYGVLVLDAMTAVLLAGAFALFCYRLAFDIRRLGRLDAFREFRRVRSAPDEVVAIIRPAQTGTSS
jgi:archaetidylinositol phosphate synthase